jgi:hypothetical protein
MRQQATFVVIAAAAAALLAGPAFAQQGGSMKTMPMKEMKSSSAPKKMKTMRTAKMKRSCMDYAWGSQDAKDCEAGKMKPPNWR